jgi:hypothetical protein
MEKKRVEVGEFEYQDWDIAFNYKVDAYQEVCPHIKDGILRTVVVAITDREKDRTIVCLDCILDVARMYKFIT